MQLPETPPAPPPLAPLWDRVLRARALPPDLDVELLYVAIRDRLTHPEWEVRLHALRVLADLLPLSGNALSFPFDQVVDNLGHSSPNVRKAALDALKVFCTHCEDVECATRAILDKCSYKNIRPHSGNIDTKANVVTGLILSIPGVMGILKRRNQSLDMFPIIHVLGEKLSDPVHRDVAQRSLLKLRRVCGPRDYMNCFSKLDAEVQDKFRVLYETYDEDSLDVYYAPRRIAHRNNNNQPLVKINHIYNSPHTGPIRLSTDTSSEESFGHIPFYSNNYAKVIIETEIKFDSDTAITMTVLEENETGSDKNTGSEDDYDSSDRNMLNYSDGESEDTDVVVKKVRFGGESVKIRTPDSDNLITSEEDNIQNRPLKKDNFKEILSPVSSNNIVDKVNEIKREELEREHQMKPQKKSGIPLPVIQNKPKHSYIAKYKGVKLKSKSLSELYDYFRSKNDVQEGKLKDMSGLTLTLADVRSPEKSGRRSRSPDEPHREVEVLHNLQRSPTVSPRRQQTRLELERDGFVLSLLASSPPRETDIMTVRTPTPLRSHYDWEELDIVPQYVADQLHNTENWIAAVKAADHLHNTLLDSSNVRKLEPAALSLVQHMWALSDTVVAARAPAEGAVCALVRSASSDCARQLLPALVSRMAREPLPAALPHALLQRLALHHIVDLIFDPSMIGVSEDKDLVQSQLRATLCLARAAGPAAVLSAVRRRLAGTATADIFCNKLRERLSRPVENIRPSHIARSSQLPVPVRRRARSTPSPVAPLPPRRLRPLPDSAPLPGVSQPGRDYILKRLSPIPLSDRDKLIAGGSLRTALRERAAAGGLLDASSVAEAPRRPPPAPAMLSLCCCPRPAPAVHPAPAPAPPSALALDLVADLPPHTRDSSALTSRSSYEDGQREKKGRPSEKSAEGVIIEAMTVIDIPAEDEDDEPPPRSRSPSIRVDNYSEKSNASPGSIKFRTEPSVIDRVATPVASGGSQSPVAPSPVAQSPARTPTSARASTTPPRSVVGTPARSRNPTPEPISDVYDEKPRPCERDVRTALAECIVPPRHEDWEVIITGLVETERLAMDPAARAPATSWRAAARATSSHVRSLRSRVARAACGTIGALFEHRGRALEPELEESAAALLDRCADVNRFLRADAAGALARVACGGSAARAVVALIRRGATHRAGPVRAAAAHALARLVQQGGASRILDLPHDARTALLRSAGELLGDASAETRVHARQLCLALGEDIRFRQMLKDAMPPSRYRAIEKYVDKLRYR